jgi:FAD/FMN-containing dehydrogenase
MSAKLTGTVVHPGNPDYESARALWDGLFQSHPKVIVFCGQPKDAVNAIAWARENGVPIRARSGRHALEGWSGVDGGITIDVSALKSVSIDSKAGTATVGTGNTQGQAVAALGGTAVTIPTGSEATVGIGGVTLGGGIGFLSRSQGVTCDSLVALDIAVPSGGTGSRLIHVDEKHHPDLLWACRGGGGGNFGVATSYTFRTHALASASACEIVWPFADWQAAFKVWQDWSYTTDAGFGSNFAVLGKQANYVALQGVYTGPESKLRDLLAPLLAIGNPKLTTSSGSYVDVFNSFNQGGRTTANWKFSSSWAYHGLDSSAIEVVDSFMSKAPAPLCNFWCLSFGDATKVEPPGGSAWFHRTPLFYAEPGAGWNEPGLTDACESWLHDFRSAMDPHVVGGYVNVPDASFSDWGTKYYGSNFHRLQRVKKAYDPHNVFRFPQSIPLPS